MYNWDAFFKQTLASNISQAMSGNYDVYRPDYTSKTTAETLLTEESGPVPMRVDADSSAYAKTKIAGLQYFGLYFDRDYPAVDAGDILQRNPTHHTPAVLVLEVEDLQQAVGVRLGNIGSILTSVDKPPLVTNVRFNYASILPPGPAIIRDSEGSENVEQRRIISWSRTQLKQGRYFRDDYSKQTYKIIEVQGDGPISTCYMELAVQ